MIQKEFKDAIFEFVKQVSDFDKIYSITLFGSAAKDEASSLSDIDLLVVTSNMEIEKDVINITNKIENEFNKKFQVIIKTKELEGLDSSMIEEISKYGILLYGSPIRIGEKDLELEPFSIAIYSLANLPQAEKMKFKRSFFGSESIFKGKSKKYKTVQDGILKMYNGARLGRGSIIFPSKNKVIINQLEYFKVKFKVFSVYANPHLVEWIKTFNESTQ